MCIRDSLKDILNGGSTAESSDKKKLEEQVKMTNVSCPMQVDEATMLNLSLIHI